jgi:hypothetical protein
MAKTTCTPRRPRTTAGATMLAIQFNSIRFERQTVLAARVARGTKLGCRRRCAQPMAFYSAFQAFQRVNWYVIRWIADRDSPPKTSWRWRVTRWPRTTYDIALGRPFPPSLKASPVVAATRHNDRHLQRHHSDIIATTDTLNVSWLCARRIWRLLRSCGAPDCASRVASSATRLQENTGKDGISYKKLDHVIASAEPGISRLEALRHAVNNPSIQTHHIAMVVRLFNSPRKPAPALCLRHGSRQVRACVWATRHAHCAEAAIVVC